MHARELFERILVAVDAEGLATHAVARGASLARTLNARLDLVQAVPIPPPMWPGIGEGELAAIHAAALANARAHTLESLAPGLRELGVEDPALALHVHPGHPAKVILDTADELMADLIVLGPHAQRSVLDFGSTTRAVLSRANRPVWTQPEAVESIRRLVVPVDFSEHSRAALEQALQVAARFDASVRIVHCWGPPLFAYATTGETIPGPTYVVDQERDAAKAELARWLASCEERSVSVDSSFLEGAVIERILAQLETSDLLVLGTHGRTGLSRFLLGSVAYGVLKRCAKPALVVPPASGDWLLEEPAAAG